MPSNKSSKDTFTQHYVMDNNLYNAIRSINRHNELKRKVKSTVIPVVLGLVIAIPSFVVLLLSK